VESGTVAMWVLTIAGENRKYNGCWFACSLVALLSLQSSPCFWC